MKLIPCDECREPVLSSRKPRQLFLVIGTMHDPTFKGVCLRCKKPFTLTSMRFSQLPEMTVDQLKAPTCDLDWPLYIDQQYEEAYGIDLFKSSYAPPPPPVRRPRKP